MRAARGTPGDAQWIPAFAGMTKAHLPPVIPVLPIIPVRPVIPVLPIIPAEAGIQLWFNRVHAPAESNAMKGGKSGKRKSSSSRAGGKPKAAKKGVKHDWTVPPRKSDRKTTRLGARRVPDDN